MFIVIATNKYGVDEVPYICKDRDEALEAMHRLLVYGINNQAPEILEDFSFRYDTNIETYDDLVENHLEETFFEELEDSNDTQFDESCIKIRFSEKESDIYEVSYWSEDSCAKIG